jgi:hypothetical protein
VPFADPVRCAGGLACGPDAGGGGGEANAICEAVCKIKGDIAAQCGKDPAPTVTTAADYKLYDVLNAHASDFSEYVRQVTIIKQDLGGVTQRTTGDFHNVGVTLDNARLCAEQAGPTYDEALSTLNEAVGASLIFVGKKF